MLATASRLALLAAVVWVARLAIRQPALDGTATMPRRTKPVRAHQAGPAVATASDGDTPYRYINLRRAPERADPATATAPREENVDPLRKRLLDYLEKRETERTPS